MRIKFHDKWFTIVLWDFNDPTKEVLFHDGEGNTCEGRVVLDMDTWRPAEENHEDSDT